jgi:predicted aconitase with swiveling domain
LKQKSPAICSDQNNRDLYHKQLDGTIICLPQFIGSTTGGLVLQTAIDMKLGPKALLFSKHIDSLAASGLVLSDVWLGQQVITVDQLGDAFLTYMKDGMDIEINPDGTVVVNI